MFLTSVVLFLILKLVLPCHTERRPGVENVDLSSENSVVNSESSAIDNINETYDEMYSQKPSLRNLDIPADESANRELVEKGRFLKKRHVVTCDGFILTIFRLIGEVKPSKMPVLMMHGLYQSSDTFAKQSKNQSLAFRLQDLGYDVWLGNLRGNKHSRHHFYLDPEDQKEEFFNSSYEEMGVHDLAATVDFILNETQYSQLQYISYSIGGTVFLVLNSLEPSYNEKFIGAHLMAPIGYQANFPPDNKLREEAMKVDTTYNALIKRGIVEIFPYTNETVSNDAFSPDECLGDQDARIKPICTKLNIEQKMDLQNKNNDIFSTRGGSIKQLAHLAQNVKSKLFNRWDYGNAENEIQYGSKIPPEYILSHVTVPTVIIYANDDEFVSPIDIIDMASDMGNAIARPAGRSNFTHEDFVTAPDVFEIVYDNIIKELEINVSQECESTFHNRYFWPIVTILIIIIAILLCALIYCCFKRRIEDETSEKSKSSHKSTQTTSLRISSQTERSREPSFPEDLSEARLPIAHSAPLRVEQLSTTRDSLPVIPKPLPVTNKYLPAARKYYIPSASSPIKPLPVKPLPALPSRTSPLSVEQVTPCQTEYSDVKAHLPAAGLTTNEYPVTPPVRPKNLQLAFEQSPETNEHLLKAQEYIREEQEHLPEAPLSVTNLAVKPEISLKASLPMKPDSCPFGHRT